LATAALPEVVPSAASLPEQLPFATEDDIRQAEAEHHLETRVGSRKHGCAESELKIAERESTAASGQWMNRTDADRVQLPV
jgi:hypothetical protein